MPILPGDYRDLELRPVGKLTVILVEAEGLRNTVTMGTSDPLAIAWVRPLFKNQTRKMNNTLNPVRFRSIAPRSLRDLRGQAFKSNTFGS